MPDRVYIAWGISATLLVAAFLLAGGHHEIRYQIRRRRYGGYLHRPPTERRR